MYSIKKHTHLNTKYFFYIVLLLNMVLLSGCSSTKVISKTYKEYIPPIEQSQKICISDHKNNQNHCQTTADFKGKECQEKAKFAAQEPFKRAKQNHLSETNQMKEQQLAENTQRKQQYLNQLDEYNKCVSNEQIRNERTKAGLPTTGGNTVYQQGIKMTFYSACIKPNPNKYPYVQSNTNNFYGQEPRLEDFINDAHCYSGNECEYSYDVEYEKCGGKIIRTTWCFANCEEDQ